MLLRSIGILCLHPVTELRNERAEVVEGAGGVIIGSIADTCQRAFQGDGGHVKRAAMGGGLASIHILDATGTVISPRGIEVDLQVADRFEHCPNLQVVDTVDGGRCGDVVFLDQPIILQSLVDVVVAYQSEGEVETRFQQTVGILSEDVADHRQETW